MSYVDYDGGRKSYFKDIHVIREMSSSFHHNVESIIKRNTIHFIIYCVEACYNLETAIENFMISDDKTYISHTLFVIDRSTKRANTQETSIMRHGE